MTTEEYKCIKDAKQNAYVAEQKAMTAKMEELKAVYKAEMAELRKQVAQPERVNHKSWTRKGAHNVCRFIHKRLIEDFHWDAKEFIVPTEETGVPMGFVIEDDKVTFNFTIMRVKREN